MNDQQLLAATGNAWRVLCFTDGNRRKLRCTMFVRAATAILAEKIARSRGGGRSVSAAPWNPLTDREMHGFIIGNLREV